MPCSFSDRTQHRKTMLHYYVETTIEYLMFLLHHLCTVS